MTKLTVSSSNDYYRHSLFAEQGSARGMAAASPMDELLSMIQQHFRDEPWVLEAACHGLIHDENFFPNGQGTKPKAVRVCMGCPVREECKDYAIRTGQMFGMWGGLSERKIKDLVHRHRRGEVVT